MGVTPLGASDEQFMSRAFELAQQAEQQGEIPVGAVVVQNGQVVGEGFNSSITNQDPTAHAEVIALRAAARAVSNYRLVDSTLYVTIEPCMMCAGAMLHARVERLVYGASEPKAGAANSHRLLDFDWQNHRISILGGVLETECSALMTNFFKRKREQSAAGGLS
ncbi:MAG: tRNA adenosine(34) deaminase TadA [Pseudomonadales bacterium]|nr:tRNA adenosine(34) deaminase TadA [Pseudomonadales bacterium]